ncbi:TIGR04197 family type VII secretion effector, partial [Lactovum odontotermitis]
MGVSKISSDTVAAQEAIQELTGIDASGFSNLTVDIGESNITAMQTGCEVNNQLMDDLSNFVQVFLTQANKFP